MDWADWCRRAIAIGSERASRVERTAEVELGLVVVAAQSLVAVAKTLGSAGMAHRHSLWAVLLL